MKLPELRQDYRPRHDWHRELDRMNEADFKLNWILLAVLLAGLFGLAWLGGP